MASVVVNSTWHGPVLLDHLARITWITKVAQSFALHVCESMLKFGCSSSEWFGHEVKFLKMCVILKLLQMGCAELEIANI